MVANIMSVVFSTCVFVCVFLLVAWALHSSCYGNLTVLSYAVSKVQNH